MQTIVQPVNIPAGGASLTVTSNVSGKTAATIYSDSGLSSVLAQPAALADGGSLTAFIPAVPHEWAVRAADGTVLASGSSPGRDSTELRLSDAVELANLSGTYAPKPSGTPTVGQVPTVTTVSPLAMGWGAGGGPTFATGTNPSLMGGWSAALAKVLAGSADAKVLFIGDSITFGGAGTPGNPTNGYPLRLSERLTALGVPAAGGLGVPPWAQTPTTDSRWTVGTGWTTNGTTGLTAAGNSYAFSAATSGTLVYADPTIMADSFDVYFAGINGNANTVTVTATGGTPTVVTLAKTPSGVGKVTVTAAAAATTNTVTFTPPGTGGTNYILGVEPFLSTSKKIRIGSWGFSGITSVNWTSGTKTPYGTAEYLTAYAPDLVVVALGVNDAILQSATPAQVAANFTTLFGYYPSASWAILTYPPSNPGIFSAAVIQQQADNVAALKATHGATRAIFDFYTRAGSYATYNGLGLMADNVHPNNKGYYDIANFLANRLMAV